MGNPAAYTPFLDRFVLERICRRTDSGGFHQLLGRYIMGSLKGSNLTNVKRQNESAIRDVIYRYGPISRSEIAQMLSLTPPTITTNIARMMEQGLVYECGRLGAEAGALGRRRVKIDFVADAAFFVGVEMNPYQIAICITNLRGVMTAEARIPWKRREDGFVLSEELKELLRRIDGNDYRGSLELLAQVILNLMTVSGIDKKQVLGCAMALPGLIERKTGTLKKSTLEAWNDRPIARDLSRLLDLPVLLENNARARAMGQKLFYQGELPEDFAYYLISYGIACPLYIGSRILDGGQQGAGEAGHMVADLNGPRCETCGNAGCLEELASERAIVKTVTRLMESGRDTMIREICPDLDFLSSREILLAQECGDELAQKVIDQALLYLGAALANIINLMNPSLVFVDSYLMKNRRRLVEDTRAHIFGLYNDEVEIEFVEFDHFTGAKGAAAAAIERYFINGEGAQTFG